MLTTYKAVLRDNVLEWQSDAPPQLASGRPLHVHVTLLEEPAPLVETEEERLARGQRMAASLEAIAQGGRLADIDGARWEREIRVDRPLPGRGDEEHEPNSELREDLSQRPSNHAN